jgi:hypothetical protein
MMQAECRVDDVAVGIQMAEQGMGRGVFAAVHDLDSGTHKFQQGTDIAAIGGT